MIINSSDIAFLIPPSIGFIVYGVATSTSIGMLFLDQQRLWVVLMLLSIPLALSGIGFGMIVAFAHLMIVEQLQPFKRLYVVISVALGGALFGFIMMWYWKKNQFNQNRWDR